MKEMTSQQFKNCRELLGLKQVELAKRLCLSETQIGYYETGETREHPPRKVTIPRTVQLAMAALRMGVVAFDGATITLAPSSAQLLEGRGTGRRQEKREGDDEMIKSDYINVIKKGDHMVRIEWCPGGIVDKSWDIDWRSPPENIRFPSYVFSNLSVEQVAKIHPTFWMAYRTYDPQIYSKIVDIGLEHIIQR